MEFVIIMKIEECKNNHQETRSLLLAALELDALTNHFNEKKPDGSGPQGLKKMPLYVDARNELGWVKKVLFKFGWFFRAVIWNFNCERRRRYVVDVFSKADKKSK